MYDFISEFFLVPNPINVNKGDPITFKCMENGIAPTGDEPPWAVSWHYCSTRGKVKPDYCESLKITTGMENWPIHVRANGDLFVPYFPDAAVTQLEVMQLYGSVSLSISR